MMMEKIANGRTAEIFAHDEKHILKLYLPEWTKADAEFEFGLAQKIQTSNIPTPAALELVEVDGRHGIIFERVYGRTLLQIIMEDPTQLASLTRKLAELQATMHNSQVKGLPDNRQRLRRKINMAQPLDEETKTAVLARLNQLPHDKCLLHGDFHFDNILMTDNGPVIIDWIDASLGHPLADVARTLIIMSHGDPLDTDKILRQQIQVMRQTFVSVYLERYGECRPFTPTDLNDWKAPIAAGRLSENILEIEADLLSVVTSKTQTSPNHQRS
ncbi:MAG: phosphotransferase [Chloroflexi bacterium]|nr:phosphotransferase [Chloroflexota bacterium]